MRRARKLITWRGAALFVATFAAGSTLVHFAPQGTIMDRPFVVEGVVGETLDLDYAQLTVTEVRTADTLDSSLGDALAGGTFLVVDATWRATQGKTQFTGAEITDTEGRVFWPTTRGGCSKGDGAQPGYGWRLTYCFDVPRDALAGATIRLARGSQFEHHAGQRRDAVAVVDLGITPQDVDALWDATATISPDSPWFSATDRTDGGSDE